MMTICLHVHLLYPQTKRCQAALGSASLQEPSLSQRCSAMCYFQRGRCLRSAPRGANVAGRSVCCYSGGGGSRWALTITWLSGSSSDLQREAPADRASCEITVPTRRRVLTQGNDRLVLPPRLVTAHAAVHSDARSGTHRRSKGTHAAAHPGRKKRDDSQSHPHASGGGLGRARSPS